jgi:cytochrome-b5 reductase
MGEVSSKHYILAKFQVFYTVDKPSNDWKGGVGYISKDMVLKGLPGPGEDSLILVSSF